MIIIMFGISYIYAAASLPNDCETKFRLKSNFDEKLQILCPYVVHRPVVLKLSLFKEKSNNYSPDSSNHNLTSNSSKILGEASE